MRPSLILGTEPRVALTISRCLKKRNIPVIAASSTHGLQPLRSNSIRRFVDLPSTQESPAAFIDALVRVATEEKCDLMFPTNDTALSLICKHRTRLEEALRLACPPSEIAARVLDKAITYSAAEQIGVLVPHSYTFTSIAELERDASTIRFPIIAKPKDKHRGHGFKLRYFDNERELLGAFRQDPAFGQDNFIQEYAPGEGVAVVVLMHSGRPVVRFQHRRVKEYPIDGGVSVVAEAVPIDEDLAALSVALLQKLEWEGVGMVEFRYDRQTRRAALMEVNGRYWGSCSLASFAGLEFPFYEWQIAHGESPSVPSTYRTGVRMRWLAGDIQRLRQLFDPPPVQGIPRPPRRGEIARFFLDFNGRTYDSLWRWDDPRPAIEELARTLKTLAVADTKRLLRRFVPMPLISDFRLARALGRRTGLNYLKARVRHRWIRQPLRLRMPPKCVVFVCHGNIIRSPMAAELLRQQAAGALEVLSAGLHATPGKQADPRARSIAPEFGVSLEAHRAQPLTTDLVSKADAIFVMDALNEAKLLDRFPEATTKICPLGRCFSGTPPLHTEIPDPYTGSVEDIRACYVVLHDNVAELARLLHLTADNTSPAGTATRA